MRKNLQTRQLWYDVHAVKGWHYLLECVYIKTMDSKFLAVGVGLLLQAGAGIWYIASVDSRVSHNNYQIQMMQPDLEEAISFTKLWPAGKWGSGELPSDTRQDLKIQALEKQVDKITNKLYNGDSE